MTAALAAVAIAALTLRPAQSAHQAEPLGTLCLLCGDAGLADFLLNTVLFTPLGSGLALTRVAARLATLLGLGYSVGIEILQYSLLQGRHAALGDVVANTFGTWLGFLAATKWQHAGRVPSRQRCLAYMAAGWAVAVGPALLATKLFQPSPGPAGGPWYGQWSNVFSNTDPFGGELLAVSLNGIAVGQGPLHDTDALRSQWHRSPLRFEATVRSGPVPARRALIAAIAEDSLSWLTAIWQDGHDVLLSLRLGAADWRLASPYLRLRGGFAHPPGTPVRLSVEVSEGALMGQAVSPVSTARVRVPLRTSLAWTAFWPWDKALSGDAPWRTAAWLAGLGVLGGALIAFWTARARAHRWGVIVAGSILPLAHMAIPWSGGLPWGTPTEWLLNAAGLGLGLATGAWLLRYREATLQRERSTAPVRPGP